MIYKKFVLPALFIILSFLQISWKKADQVFLSSKTFTQNIDSAYIQYKHNLFQNLKLDSLGLNEQVFDKAITGYFNLKYMGYTGLKPILTIVDFDQESINKRLYIIDIDKRMLLINSWVAHGIGSGENMAYSFSNSINSHQSSLGFYITSDIYAGKHGRSLKLDGMDQGFNDRARERAIVLHGADYVSQNNIDRHGRLGRSQGCPAVSKYLANEIIDLLAERTVLFMNSSVQAYNSIYLNQTLAANVALNFPNNYNYVAQMH